MIIQLLILIFGIIILIKGADFFVESSAKIAKHFGVSEFIIGLTLVSFGTSIPELASAVVAAFLGNTELVLGNVIGSNIANIGLIIGVSALLMPLVAQKEMLNRDGYIMMLVNVIFILFALNNSINIFEGIIFIIIYFAYLLFLLESDELKHTHIKEFIEFTFKFKYLNTLKNFKTKPKETEKTNLFKQFLISTGGLIGIVLGADLLINEATFFAKYFGVSDAVIGITLVAVGTSLPELMVTLSAVRNKYQNIALGNIIGSNIANLMLILGISSFITPLTFNFIEMLPSLLMMTGLSMALLIFMRINWKVQKLDGAVLLMAYIIFIGGLIL